MLIARTNVQCIAHLIRGAVTNDNELRHMLMFLKIIELIANPKNTGD